MTPANPDALADALAYLKPHETNGGTISLKASKAREAVAVIEAALQRVTAERDAEQAEDARFAIAYTTARGAMDYEHMARVLSGRLRRMDRRAAAANRRADAAEARAAQLQAEVEALKGAKAAEMVVALCDSVLGNAYLGKEGEEALAGHVKAAFMSTALAARATTAREGQAD